MWLCELKLFAVARFVGGLSWCSSLQDYFVVKVMSLPDLEIKFLKREDKGTRTWAVFVACFYFTSFMILTLSFDIIFLNNAEWQCHSFAEV